ncbi:hypothetical protein H9L13_05115 [Sphingomonas lutea]|uniref:Uncharacterized protein n=1 Tax=Sphingomonas lutea TaxID=1045317 RepID=A0A7G9SK80_9SPHN|nr:hypothetical protein [Sphingomonas lutea]QNN68255.1 hypothetical protein H9L13_05115 [Sphingomonas lutea]
MIYKRFAANLRAQNWFAIGIELLIVVVGVFIGTWVANWNQERAAQAETRRMIAQLDPSLRFLQGYFDGIRAYYGVTRKYAETAQAGWDGRPGVSESAFVIAAYQASQIAGIGTNGSAWANVLGADRLREIEDTELRTDLSTLMSSDYAQIDTPAVDTPYRRNVRRLIPMGVQERIRERCGDRPPQTIDEFVTLPARCDLVIDAEVAAQTAAKLRSRPEVLEDLQWHMAAQAALLGNLGPFEAATTRVRERLDRLER